MPRKTAKRGSLALGFLITVGVLSLLIVGLYISGSGIPVLQIPIQLPEYGGLLGRYAPSNALQVSYDNLTAIRAINQSLISNKQFLNLDEPRITLNTTELTSRLTVALSRPNATVDAGFLTPDAFRRLSTAFSTTSAPSVRVGNFTLYTVVDRHAKLVQAFWITLIPRDRGVAYSPGALPALEAVEQIIGVNNGTLSSILANQDVVRMLYTVDGTQGHLALGIQNFAGAVRTGQATLIAVDALQATAQISYVVRFLNPSQASEQTGAVKSVYLTAHLFVRYDELVKAVEIQPASNLRAAISLVG